MSKIQRIQDPYTIVLWSVSAKVVCTSVIWPRLYIASYACINFSISVYNPEVGRQTETIRCSMANGGLWYSVSCWDSRMIISFPEFLFNARANQHAMPIYSAFSLFRTDVSSLRAAGMAEVFLRIFISPEWIYAVAKQTENNKLT